MGKQNEDKNYLMRKVTLIIIASYFILQIMFSLVAGTTPGNTIFIKLMMILQSVVPAMAILFWASNYGLFIPEIIKLNFDTRFINLIIALLLAAGFFLLTEGLSNSILSLLPQSIFQDLSEQLYRPSYNLLLIRDFPDLLVVGLGIAIVIPFLEELVFRGLALGVFRKAVGINQASVFSAVLWAFLHMNPVDFLSMMIMGVVFAYLTHRTGSVWLAIIVHIIFSLTELIYLNTFEFSNLMDLPGWEMNALMIISGIVLVVGAVQLTDRAYPVIRKI